MPVCWGLLKLCDCCLFCESSRRPQAEQRPHYTVKGVHVHAGRRTCCSSPSPRSCSLTRECDNCEDQGKGDCSSLGSVTCSRPAPWLSRLQRLQNWGVIIYKLPFHGESCRLPPAASLWQPGQGLAHGRDAVRLKDPAAASGYSGQRRRDCCLEARGDQAGMLGIQTREGY